MRTREATKGPAASWLQEAQSARWTEQIAEAVLRVASVSIEAKQLAELLSLVEAARARRRAVH